MNKDTKTIIEKFIKLDKTINKMMKAKCGSHCGDCEITCCTPVICLYILKSNWLFSIVRYMNKMIKTSSDFTKMIKRHFRDDIVHTKPCPLSSGKPNICTQFFCETIISNIDNNLNRFLLFQLADIIPNFLNQRVFRLKITNIDLLNNKQKLNKEQSAQINKHLNISYKKLKIIKKYILNNILDSNINNFFDDISFLEKHSGMSVNETFSLNTTVI